MNYKIIANIDTLQEFVDTLDQKESYVVQLAIRNKYADYKINKNYNVLRSEMLETRNIVSFIKQLECPVGSYETHLNEPINNNSGFVIYISVNTINQLKAFQMIALSLTEMLMCNLTLPGRLQTLINSRVFKSNNRNVLDIEFDYDHLENPEEYDDIVVKQVCEYLGNSDIVRFVRTRGGMHCLVETKKIPKAFKKTAIMNIRNMEHADVAATRLSHAVPGTFQGLKEVKLINRLDK
jgi:hypothetical protein